jgi:hypothetical protein
MPFNCSICEEESTRICVACTKDSCENHLCEKCGRCSDCCGCEVSLNEASPQQHAHTGNGTGHEPSVMESPGISEEDVPGEDLPG